LKRTLLYLIFFISGFCGLCYEVIWGREFHLVLGNTTYAVSAVLASFMAGLAGGSYFFGRLCDASRSPLALYAYLEFGIGLFGLVFLWIAAAYKALFVFAYPFLSSAGVEFAFKFASSLAMIIIPTTLMGATFPVMARIVLMNVGDRGGQIGLIYFLNSLGGALGCVVSGFYMIEEFGVEFSLNIVAMLNILCGIVSLAIARYADEEVPRVVVGDEKSASSEASVFRYSGEKIIFRLFFISGFSSMIFEVAWTRFLILIIGSSTYSFSLMLFTFILFLAVGSLLMSRFADGFSEPLAAFGACLIFLGSYIAVTMPYYDSLPVRLIETYSGANLSYVVFMTLNFLICAVVMAVPALAFGATFPIAVRCVSMGLADRGALVGKLYSVNTVGCIAGSLCAGLFILPALGLRASLAFGVTLILVAGAAAITASVSTGTKAAPRFLAAVAALVMAFVVVLSPGWDSKILNIGSFYRKAGATADSVKKEVEKYRTLYYREGVSSTVYVFEDLADGEISLKINGKTDGSTSKYDMITQKFIGLIPMLKAVSPKKALVIGLGTGNTLGMLTKFKSLEKIVCIEISPEVIEAAKCFRDSYDSYSTDRRVSIIVADARSYMLANGEKYDVIISEPSNPWIAGISSLYTTEFFSLCRERIAPGGSMLAWIQIYESSSDVFKLMLRTFISQFPESELWYNCSGDIFAVWSEKREEPLKAIPRYYKKITDVPEIAGSVKKAGFTSEVSFAGLFFMTGGQLHKFVGDGVLNSDNFQSLEFEAPRLLYTAGRIKPDFRPFVDNYIKYVNARRVVLGRREVAEGILNFIDYIGFKSKYPEVPLALVDYLISDDPADHRAYFVKSKLCFSLRSFNEAFDCIEKAIALAPGNIEYIAARAEVAYMISLGGLNAGGGKYIAMSLRDWRTACAEPGASYVWRVGLALALREIGDIKGMTEEALRFAAGEKNQFKAFTALYNFSINAAGAMEFADAERLLAAAEAVYPDGSLEVGIKRGEYAASKRAMEAR